MENRNQSLSIKAEGALKFEKHQKKSLQKKTDSARHELINKKRGIIKSRHDSNAVDNIKSDAKIHYVPELQKKLPRPKPGRTLVAERDKSHQQ